MCFPPCAHVKYILKIKIKNVFRYISNMACMYTQVFYTCFYLAPIFYNEPFPSILQGHVSQSFKPLQPQNKCLFMITDEEHYEE